MSPLATITGRVLMPDGSPAVGASIGAAGRPALTDKDGRFNVKRGVLGRPTIVYAMVPPYSPRVEGSSPPKYRGNSKPFEVRPGEEKVDVGDITLEPYRPRRF